MHSFGGVTDGKGINLSRNIMEKCLEILDQNKIFPRVYSNHGTTLDTQNVGGQWATYQKGDVIGDKMYHLDLTLKHGFKFFWTDIDYDNVNPFFNIKEFQNEFLINQISRNKQNLIRFKRFRGNLKYPPYIKNFSKQVDYLLSKTNCGYSVIYQHLGIDRNSNGKPFARQN